MQILERIWRKLANGSAGAQDVARDTTLPPLQPPVPQIVSLGSFCIVRGMIDLAGADQPSYPFDDIFACIEITIDCLENGFDTFLDHEQYLPCMNDNSWVQRSYRERFGQDNTFAHHDMRLAVNREKFRRRVDRFLALRAEDRPLFVWMGFANVLASSERLESLRTALSQRFGPVELLIFLLCEGKPELDHVALPATTIVRVHAVDGVDGTNFRNHADTAMVVEMIRSRSGLMTVAA